MKLLSIFVIVFIAKISATPYTTLTESSTTATTRTSFSSVGQFSTVFDVSGFSSVPVSNAITAASLFLNPATETLVAAQNSATVTGRYGLVSQTIADVNMALKSGSAMDIFLELFKFELDIFAGGRFQTDSEVSKVYAEVPKTYGIGVTAFQALLNSVSGVGLQRSQLSNLIVNSINELNKAFFDIIIASQTYVDLVLQNPKAHFIQAANGLAVIKLSGVNVLLQALTRLAAAHPSLVAVQNAIEADVGILSKAIKDLTAVVAQITDALQSNSVDNRLCESAKSYSNALKNIVRSFG